LAAKRRISALAELARMLQAHRKVAVVASVSINLPLHPLGQSLSHMLPSCQCGSERRMESRGRVVVANEWVFSERCERVDELSMGKVSSGALTKPLSQRTARLIHPISSSQRCKLSCGLCSGGA
jgi:hypothetical protein